jgi:hypothetical protein
MATIRQSQAVNMAGWTPAPQPAQAATKSSPPDPRVKRLPNMLAPMPLIASTNDALTRQFYGGSNVPTFRILPTKGGGS